MFSDREKEVIQALNTAIMERRVRVVEGANKKTRTRMSLLCITEEETDSVTYIPVAQLLVDVSDTIEIPRVAPGELDPEDTVGKKAEKPARKRKRAAKKSPRKSAKRSRN